MKETERPKWKIGHNEQLVITGDTPETQSVICTCHGSSLAECEETAKLIVKAVNNFDGLTEACKTVASTLRQLQEKLSYNTEKETFDDVAIDQIFDINALALEQALAKLEK